MSDLWQKSWTPIAPHQDAEKNLIAIRNLFGPTADAKPIPLDMAQLTPQDDIDVRYSYESMSLGVASALSIGNYIDTSVNFHEQVHSFDFAVGIFESFDGPTIKPEQIITGTFWGMTVRVLLRVKMMQAGTKVEANVGPVGFASAVELGHATVEFQADGICSDPVVLAAVLEGLPLTGKFDIQAYSRFSQKLERAQQAMLDAARKSPDRLLPIGVMLRSELAHDSFMDEARSLRLCLGEMQAGQRLESALKRLPARVDRHLVTELYLSRLGGDGSGPVDPASITWAKNQLG